MHEPVLDGFHDTTRSRPRLIALIDGARRVSYEELNRRAGEVAAGLHGAGAGPDTIVGVHLPRSADYVAAVLGVLKTGAAFVPLDPGYPASWLARVCTDVGVRHCVSTAPDEDLQRLAGFQHTVLMEPGDTATGSSAPAELPVSGDPRQEPHPGQLAYVIFTSGSTGSPKAVGVPYAGLASLVAWHRSAYDIGPGSVTTSVTDISFDASVWEILGTVCSGGTIVLPSEEERSSPASLAALFSRHQVTTAFLPTVTGERLLGEKAWGSLRRLLVGGDLLHPVGELGDDGPVVVNHYGPTEGAVVATAGTIDQGAEPHIGTPLPHVTVHVLDEAMNPVPAGTVGELFVGGPGLARGYLGQAATTAGSFVPDPFGEPGARLYRTGDLGWLREDGRLAFSGRKEGFVKIRGYRVGLREIEAAAESHPRVHSAAAVAVSGPDGLSVIGLWAAVGSSELTGLDLRTYLAKLLPGHLVPSRFVLRDSLPVTDRGKVDRAAVAAGFATPPDGSRRPPGNAVEEILLLVWQEVLELRDIGVDDDFFDLGGHSILATELTSLVKEHFSLDEMPLEVFYENPTVAALAREVELMTANRHEAEPVR